MRKSVQKIKTTCIIARGSNGELLELNVIKDANNPIKKDNAMEVIKEEFNGLEVSKIVAVSNETIELELTTKDLNDLINKAKFEQTELPLSESETSEGEE